MITEDYVSFETAKLLKEKGFDEECWNAYTGNNWTYEPPFKNSEFNLDDEKSFFTTPTLQMAMKWLREKYDLHIEITSVKPYNFDGPLAGVKYHSNIVQNNKWIEIIKKFKSHNIACYSSYEEACEAAIKYCLKNLI